MNSVQLIGRLTKVPEVRYTSGSQMAVATFNLAISRPTKKDGREEVDFPRCTAFGKTAETIEKYLTKGDQVGIEGRIQTGSYEDRNGNTVYTTDVIVNRITFCQKGREEKQERPPQQEAPNGFEALDEEVPF